MLGSNHALGNEQLVRPLRCEASRISHTRARLDNNPLRVIDWPDKGQVLVIRCNPWNSALQLDSFEPNPLQAGLHTHSLPAPLQLHKLEVASEDFERGWEIYELSFPSDERRSLEAHARMLQHPNYKFHYHKDATGRVVGILAAWELGERDFSFIEHLAVAREARQQGIGSEIVREFIRGRQKVVLEVEPEDASPEAARRVEFYQKLGFQRNEYDYFQPPYDDAKKPIQMRILSYPQQLTSEEFESFRGLVYARVYKVEPSSQFYSGAQSSGRERSREKTVYKFYESMNELG